MTWLGILQLLKSVPAWLWGVLLAAFILVAVHHHGVNSGLAQCEESHRKAQEAADAKQAAATAKRDDKASGIAIGSHKAAEKASDAVKTETAKSSERIREIYRDNPAGCAMPVGLQAELGKAVESANRANH